MAYKPTPDELRDLVEAGGEMNSYLKHTLEQMNDRETIDSYTREIDCLFELPPQVREKHPLWRYLK